MNARRLTVLIAALAALAAVGIPPAPADDRAPAVATPLFEGLGKHTRKITTSKPEAQQYFDQGLNFLFAFNHDEAIRSFQEAGRIDPECPMAFWGVALANGPHINFPMVPPERAAAAWEALTRARELAPRGTDLERELIEALSTRYANPQPEDRHSLDEAYSNAMREVWKRHPEDADLGALFAEAAMDLRPWNLWTQDKKPQPGTPEIVGVLEQVLKLDPQHPLGLHLYIHAVEASDQPGKAEAPADRLRLLAPGLGHLVHMPSHIDVLLGQWQKAIDANVRASAADTRMVTRSGHQPGFYRLYMAHNRHILAFAAMMQGQRKVADDSLRTMLAEMPQAWKEQNPQIADGFHAMPYELQMRFGMWKELLAQPEPPAYFPIARTLRLAAQGVAHAALGQTREARESQRAFRASAAAVPKEVTFGNNTAAGLFGVAEKLLDGEILFREGKRGQGLAALREAAALEDQLRYDEPPDWIQPVRHALGASLMVAGKYGEAENVYREDLAKWPHNGWSLYGLSRALQAQGKKAEAGRARGEFDNAWSRADTQITSSCFCQPGKRP